jgi:hypothetical protein
MIKKILKRKKNLLKNLELAEKITNEILALQKSKETETLNFYVSVLVKDDRDKYMGSQNMDDIKTEISKFFADDSNKRIKSFKAKNIKELQKDEIDDSKIIGQVLVHKGVNQSVLFPNLKSKREYFAIQLQKSVLKSRIKCIEPCSATKNIQNLLDSINIEEPVTV